MPTALRKKLSKNFVRICRASSIPNVTILLIIVISAKMNNQQIKIKINDGSTLTLEVPEINHRLQNGSLSWGKCGQGEGMVTFLPLRSKIFAYYGVLPPPREKDCPINVEPTRLPTTKGSAFTRINTKGNEVHDYGSLVDGLPQLPTLPHIVIKLAEQTGDPHQTNLNKVESYIREDQSITAHVLKMANKARFVAHGKAKTMTDAIQLLGLEKIKRMAIAAGFLGKFLEDSPETFEWSEFWKHAIGVGIVSSLVAKHLDRDDYEVLFTAGLLHDIGKVIAFSIDEQNMLKVVRYAQERKISMLQAEIEIGAPRHDTLGAVMCERWSLPKPILEVARYHHVDSRAQRSLDTDSPYHDYVDIVILANYIVQKLHFGFSGHRKVEAPSAELLANLSLEHSDVEKLTELGQREIDLSDGLLELLEK
jgi:putative nucleotidyltransferase with HDIG domain